MWTHKCFSHWIADFLFPILFLLLFAGFLSQNRKHISPKICIMVPCVKMKAGLRKDVFHGQCWSLLTWTNSKFSSQNLKWTVEVQFITHYIHGSKIEVVPTSFFYYFNMLLCTIFFKNYYHRLCVRFHFPIHFPIHHYYYGLYLHWVYIPQNTEGYAFPYCYFNTLLLPIQFTLIANCSFNP